MKLNLELKVALVREYGMPEQRRDFREHWGQTKRALQVAGVIEKSRFCLAALGIYEEMGEDDEQV